MFVLVCRYVYQEQVLSKRVSVNVLVWSCVGCSGASSHEIAPQTVSAGVDVFNAVSLGESFIVRQLPPPPPHQR